MSSITRPDANTRPVFKFSIRDGATALTTWNHAANNPQCDDSYVSIFIEPEILVTGHVSTKHLFTHAPALQRFWDDLKGRIVLPAGSVDEWSEATESIVKELTSSAKEGKQPFVMIAWDPLWLINAHRALVLFGRDSEAVQCIRALWTLLGHHALTPEQIEWIWSTFSPHFSATTLGHKPWPEGPYVCPSASEYIQAMLWQLLNLREEKNLDVRTLNYLNINTDLQRTMEKRYRKFKLGSKYRGTEISVRNNPFEELVTSGVKKMRINEAGDSKETENSYDGEDIANSEPEADDQEEKQFLDEYFGSAKKSQASKALPGPPHISKSPHNLPSFTFNGSGARFPLLNKPVLPAVFGEGERKDKTSESEYTQLTKSHIKNPQIFVSGGVQASNWIKDNEIKTPPTSLPSISSVLGANNVGGSGTAFTSNAGSQSNMATSTNQYGHSISITLDNLPSKFSNPTGTASIIEGGASTSTTLGLVFEDNKPTADIPSSIPGGYNASIGGLGQSVFTGFITPAPSAGSSHFRAAPSPGNDFLYSSNMANSNIFGSAATRSFNPPSPPPVNPPPTIFNSNGTVFSTSKPHTQGVQPWGFNNSRGTGGENTFNFKEDGSGESWSHMFDFQASGNASSAQRSGRRFARATGAKGVRRR